MLTRFARAREHDRLKPCWEVVHDRKVAHGHHEARSADEHRHWRSDECRRQDRLSGVAHLDDDEANEQRDREREGHIYDWRCPLAEINIELELKPIEEKDALVARC